jgi:hypothetical protein
MIRHSNAICYKIAFYDLFQGLSSFFESNPKKVNKGCVPPVSRITFNIFNRRRAAAVKFL